jgi:hypothetical protein
MSADYSFDGLAVPFLIGLGLTGGAVIGGTAGLAIGTLRFSFSKNTKNAKNFIKTVGTSSITGTSIGSSLGLTSTGVMLMSDTKFLVPGLITTSAGMLWSYNAALRAKRALDAENNIGKDSSLSSKRKGPSA